MTPHRQLALDIIISEWILFGNNPSGENWEYYWAKE